LRKLGFRLDRVEGSHYMMIKNGHTTTVPVPVHGSRHLPRGALASVIRISGAGKRAFFAALK
jgi:predicted RNA binding protein YcfA (HicA-like mRNA interferase family)